MCGPKGKHNPSRAAVRRGSENGSVTLGAGGCRSSGRGCARPTARGSCWCRPTSCSARPRCSAGGDGPDARWSVHPSLPGRARTGRRASRADGSLDEQVRDLASLRGRGRGGAGRAAHRRPVRSGSGGVADHGVHIGEHLCVVALGIGIGGAKHPPGLAEGSTENTTVVTDLLTGLRERGLDTSRPILVGIEGGNAVAGRGAASLRPPGDPEMPTPQDQKRGRQAARSPRLDRRQADAHRLPRRLGDPRPSATGSPRQRARARGAAVRKERVGLGGAA